MTGSPPFSARVESDPRRVVVEGELDLASSQQLSSLLRDALQGEDGQVVRFEFGGVTFMDSSGLASLLQVAEAGHQVVLCGAGEPVRRVIEATGLEGVIRVEP
jgi:anti-anti-sigma factor